MKDIGKELLKQWKDEIVSLQLPCKFYLLAACMFILASIVFLIPLKLATVAANTLLIAFLFALGIGFISWAWPKVRERWSTQMGKLVISVIHLFILIFAMALSRELVARALELPAQDFDLTVYFLLLLLYIPVWIAVFTILVFIAFIILFVRTAILQLLYLVKNHPIAQIILFKKRDFFSRFRFYNYCKGEILDRSLIEGCGHTCGAAAISFPLIALLIYIYNTQDAIYSQTSQPIRYVAYMFDFKPMSNYPGVKQQERIRLHQNGVISSAKIINNRV